MSYRSLALALAAFSSMHVASADAQSVYVAPGGVYVGGGPVYVIPAPTHRGGPLGAPQLGIEIWPPRRGGAARSCGSDDGLWTQRRLLRTAHSGSARTT